MQKFNKRPISQLAEADGLIEAVHVQAEALAHQPIDQLKEILKHFGIIELIKTAILRMDAQASELLDTTRAAAYLGISEGQLRNKTSNGTIPHYKMDRLNRYKRSELEALLSKEKRGRDSDGN